MYGDYFNCEEILVVAIDFQERLMPAMMDSAELEQKASNCLKACEILDIPVVFTQQYTKGLGETVESIRNSVKEFSYIEKTSFSCMGEEKFKDEVEKSGRNTIIIIGIETHICVQQTVRDLRELEYDVVILKDLVSSRKEVDNDCAIERMRGMGAKITTMESFLFDILGDATNPKRKAISELIK